MKIRLITEDDIINNEITIKNLIEENFRINLKEIRDVLEVVDNVYDNMLRFQRDGTAILIGAFKKTTLIGFLWAYRRDFLGEQRLHITNIIVESDARSGGVGKQMLRKLEAIANEAGIRKIELMAAVENKKIMNFYMKNGFVIERVQFGKEVW